MANRRKVMVFRDGPEEGKELEWKGNNGPPPTAHAVVDGSTIAVYNRMEIKSHEDQIDYIYVLTEYMEG